jgi:hypothetical protein
VHQDVMAVDVLKIEKRFVRTQPSSTGASPVTGQCASNHDSWRPV